MCDVLAYIGTLDLFLFLFATFNILEKEPIIKIKAKINESRINIDKQISKIYEIESKTLANNLLKLINNFLKIEILFGIK